MIIALLTLPLCIEFFYARVNTDETIHDQATNHVLSASIASLLSFFSLAERTALQLLIQRLWWLPGLERIGEYNAW